MTTEMLIPRKNDAVKTELHEELQRAIGKLMDSVEGGASARQVELEAWSWLAGLGRLMLADAFAALARRATEEDLRKRGLTRDDVRMRTDADYWHTVNTTVGRVSFPLYAYRDSSSGLATVTRVPAREGAFSIQQHCKSSEVLLEWEARLGCEFPFRRADEALTFFSHGAVSVEDTTIARHMLKVGTRIEREWLYRPVHELREILTQTATRNSETGQPILYISCDAHALRRYVDETWDAQWKMANGIRLWCIDRKNGATIHIGGEYTWGDCRQVGTIFAALKASGHLPDNGDYGAGLTSKLVFVSDGMPWFEEHILPLFPWAIAVLDAYHVMERLAAYGNERFERGSPQSRKFYNESLTALFGERPARRRKAKARKGKRRRKAKARKGGRRRPHVEVPPVATTAAGGAILIARLKQEVFADVDDRERHEKLVAYLEHNVLRIDYPRFRSLGYQIGSGAMESIHRTASQCRLRIPGGRWLEETSQAIFNLRMMLLAGRWNDFWNRSDLRLQLTRAFSPITARPARA